MIRVRCRKTAYFMVVALVMAVLTASVSLSQSSADQEESSAAGGESNEMNGTIIHADLLLENCGDYQAELYVNDIPVARAGGTLQRWASVPVPEYLIDGTNTLTVIIGIGETPSTARDGLHDGKCDSQMAAWARIVRMKDGEMAEPGSGETLLEIKWTGEEKEPLPVVVSAEEDIGTQFGDWKWQSADVLTLDSATYESAATFISEINAAYTGGNPDPIIKAAKFKHSEAGRAYPIYGDISFDEMFREQIEMFSGEPDWKPYSLPRSEFDLRLVADGRLIEAVAKDWRPILRMENGDYAYQMFIGKVEGEWQILR